MSAFSKKILINASNLHVGGGVQVAVSLIYELSFLSARSLDLSVLVSREVHESLSTLKPDVSRFTTYEVFDSDGLRVLWSGLHRKFNEFDVVFTVFGPLYLFRVRAINVVGFAQPWIIYPQNEVYKGFSFIRRMVLRSRFLLQSYFFSKADRLIVELEHVRARLIELGISQLDLVDVVRNCVATVYYRPEQWMPLHFERNDGVFAIGYVGRDYPHKNTDIFPYIKRALADVYNLRVDFYVTFTDDEWAAKSGFFRSNVRNVGKLQTAQCPTFYYALDAVIFPSLLECFSATPLEAMAMERPLFASDRQFVRDVCGEFAHYFDPLDSAGAAEIIARYIRGGGECDFLRSARTHVEQFSRADDRATRYLRIIECAVKSGG